MTLQTSVDLVWDRGGPTLRSVDEYIDGHPHACFGHSAAWRRAVFRAYRLPACVVVARRAGAVVGVVPFTLMLSPLVGPYLVVAPFASYGDLLADDAGVARELCAATTAWMRRRLVAYAQLRSRYAGGPAVDDIALCTGGRFVTSLVPLDGGAEGVWRDRLDRKRRNQVRKARRLGVRVEEVSRAPDGWDALLAVCESGARSLGSPFHGRRFFAALADELGDRLLAWVACSPSGAPAAAAVAVRHGRELHEVYAYNAHDLRWTCANVLLAWRLIEAACDAGLAAVDLGRSERGSPVERFKRQFGAVIHALDETILRGVRRAAPDLNPTNPGFARARRLWRALPLAATRRLSPLLMRGIG